MSFSDWLAVAGIVVTVALAVVAFYSPTIWNRWRRRQQVREIWASIEEIWEPEEQDLHTKVLIGGRLVVRNPTPRPVKNVIVTEPAQIAAQDFDIIDPRTKAEIRLPTDLTNEIRDVPVVLQVTDSNGLVWRWTPSQTKAELLSKRMDMLSRADRWAARNVRFRIAAGEPPVPGPEGKPRSNEQ